MCTLTWLLHDHGYDLFFNRDEQRSRPRARPPALDAGRQAVYPVDPSGGGTWVALTRSGVSFCLLNNYQAQALPERRNSLISRGQLILDLLDSGPGPAEQAIQALRPERFAPFICVCFAPQVHRQQAQPRAVHWNGRTLLTEDARPPLVSSAVSLEAVRQWRNHSFEASQKTPEGLLALHRSHRPQAGACSVCMHRPDAETHSLSHIQVHGEQRRFTYYDGSPCNSSKSLMVELT